MYVKYTFVCMLLCKYGTDHSQRREYPRVVCLSSPGRVRVVPGSSACRARVECLPEVHAQVPTHLYLPRENFNFSPYILYIRTCTLRYNLTRHLSLVPSRIARQT